VALNNCLTMSIKTTDKRDEILDAAEILFAEHGFEAVSVREISKAADINIAMISYYFGSKEKLYEEVVNRKLISLNQLQMHLNKLPTYHQQLITCLDILLDKLIERRNFQNIIFREITVNQRTKMSDKIASALHQNFQFIADIIQKGIKNNEFKKVDVNLTVMSVFGILRMYVTSGNMACRIMNLHQSEDIFSTTNKKRLKTHLHEMLTNHLIN